MKRFEMKLSGYFNHVAIVPLGYAPGVLVSFYGRHVTQSFVVESNEHVKSISHGIIECVKRVDHGVVKVYSDKDTSVLIMNMSDRLGIRIWCNGCDQMFVVPSYKKAVAFANGLLDMVKEPERDTMFDTYYEDAEIDDEIIKIEQKIKSSGLSFIETAEGVLGFDGDVI